MMLVMPHLHAAAVMGINITATSRALNCYPISFKRTACAARSTRSCAACMHVPAHAGTMRCMGSMRHCMQRPCAASDAHAAPTEHDNHGHGAHASPGSDSSLGAHLNTGAASTAGEKLLNMYTKLEQLHDAAAALAEHAPGDQPPCMDIGRTLLMYGEQLNDLLLAMAHAASQGHGLPHDLLGAVAQSFTWEEWLVGPRERIMEKCPGIKTDGIQAFFQLASRARPDSCQPKLAAQLARAFDALYFYGKFALPVHPSDTESPGIVVSLTDCQTLMAAACRARLPHVKYVVHMQRVLSSPPPAASQVSLTGLGEAVHTYYAQFDQESILDACGQLDGQQVRDMARFIQAAREHISDPQAPEAAGLHVHHFCVALLTALVHTTSVPAPPRAPRRIPGSPFQLRAASGPLVHSSRHASGQASSSTGTTSSSTTNTDVGSTKDSVSNSGGATISTTSTSRSGRSGNSSGRSQVSQLSATAVQPLYTQDVGRVCTEVVWLVCKERRHLNLEMKAELLSLCHHVLRTHGAVFENPTSVCTFLDNVCAEMAHPGLLAAAVQLLALWPEPCLSAAGRLVAALTHRLHWFSDEQLIALVGPLHRLAAVQAQCVRDWYARKGLQPELQALRLLGDPEEPDSGDGRVTGGSASAGSDHETHGQGRLPEFEILMCAVTAPHEPIQDYNQDFASSAWDMYPARGAALEGGLWAGLDLASRMGLRVAHYLAAAGGDHDHSATGIRDGAQRHTEEEGHHDMLHAARSREHDGELRVSLRERLGLE